MDARSAWSRLRDTLLKHRTRLSSLALVIFLVLIGIELGGAAPRTVDMAVPLGAGYADVAEARIEVLQEGESVRTITRRFRDEAPREVRDSVSLAPGEYDVAVTLVSRDGAARALRGRLTSPSDGVVRIRLEGR